MFYLSINAQTRHHFYKNYFSDFYSDYFSSLITALKTLNHLNEEGEALALQDDLTTHPTLALMRRILADAQVSITSANFLIAIKDTSQAWSGKSWEPLKWWSSISLNHAIINCPASRIPWKRRTWFKQLLRQEINYRADKELSIAIYTHIDIEIYCLYPELPAYYIIYRQIAFSILRQENCMYSKFLVREIPLETKALQ